MMKKCMKAMGYRMLVVAFAAVVLAVQGTASISAEAALRTGIVADEERPSEIGRVMLVIDDGNAGTAVGYRHIFGVPMTVRDLFDADYYEFLYDDVRQNVGSRGADSGAAGSADAAVHDAAQVQAGSADLQALADTQADPQADAQAQAQADVLYEHFIKHGLAEGRTCSPHLNLPYYIDANPDLKAKFGQDYDSYVRHYFTTGIYEGRPSGASDLDLQFLRAMLTAWTDYASADPAVAEAAARTAGADVFDSLRFSEYYVGTVSAPELLSSAVLTHILGAKASLMRDSLDLKKLYGRVYLDELVKNAKAGLPMVRPVAYSPSDSDDSADQSTSGSGIPSTPGTPVPDPSVPDGGTPAPAPATPDDGGSIVMPWDYVENGYVTLDMIKEHCGSSLFLVQNPQGDVTFLGGNISSRVVTDAASALAAAQSFTGVLKFPEGTCVLMLNETGHDSAGNTLYTFYSQDKDTGTIATTVTDVSNGMRNTYNASICIKADTAGNVIALSASPSSSFDTFQMIGGPNGKTVIDSRYKMTLTEAEAAAKVAAKYTILKSCEIGDYQAENKNNYYAYYAVNKETGDYNIIYVDKSDGGVSISRKIDKDIYESSGGSASFAYDYLFKDVKVTDTQFTDHYGRTVTLPVAEGRDDAGNPYFYLISPEYKLLMIRTQYDLSDIPGELSVDDLVKFSSLEELKANDVVVTSFSNMLDARRFFYENDPDKAGAAPYVIAHSTKLIDNAVGGSNPGCMNMQYFSAGGVSFAYAAAGHEMTHSMTLWERFGSYTNYAGALSEGYADIVGMALQQAAYSAYIDAYAAANAVSYDAAKAYVEQHWGDGRLSADWYSGITDRSTNAAGDFVTNWNYAASDPLNTAGPYLTEGGKYSGAVGDANFNANGTEDNYSCHANSSVLAHVAWQMYDSGVVKDAAELAKLWYDTIPYVTGASEFYDVRFYVEEVMSERGYSAEDIAKVDGFFVAANITEATRDSNLLATPAANSAESNMSAEYGIYDPAKQAAYDAWVDGYRNADVSGAAALKIGTVGGDTEVETAEAEVAVVAAAAKAEDMDEVAETTEAEVAEMEEAGAEAENDVNEVEVETVAGAENESEETGDEEETEAETEIAPEENLDLK